MGEAGVEAEVEDEAVEGAPLGLHLVPLKEEEGLPEGQGHQNEQEG